MAPTIVVVPCHGGNAAEFARAADDIIASVGVQCKPRHGRPGLTGNTAPGCKTRYMEQAGLDPKFRGWAVIYGSPPAAPKGHYDVSHGFMLLSRQSDCVQGSTVIFLHIDLICTNARAGHILMKTAEKLARRCHIPHLSLRTATRGHIAIYRGHGFIQSLSARLTNAARSRGDTKFVRELEAEYREYHRGETCHFVMTRHLVPLHARAQPRKRGAKRAREEGAGAGAGGAGAGAGSAGSAGSAGAGAAGARVDGARAAGACAKPRQAQRHTPTKGRVKKERATATKGRRT